MDELDAMFEKHNARESEKIEEEQKASIENEKYIAKCLEVAQDIFELHIAPTVDEFANRINKQEGYEAKVPKSETSSNNPTVQLEMISTDRHTHIRKSSTITFYHDGNSHNHIGVGWQIADKHSPVGEIGQVSLELADANKEEIKNQLLLFARKVLDYT